MNEEVLTQSTRGSQEDQDKLHALIDPVYEEIRKLVTEQSVKFDEAEGREGDDKTNVEISTVATILSHTLIMGYKKGDLTGFSMFEYAVNAGAQMALAEVQRMQRLEANAPETKH